MSVAAAQQSIDAREFAEWMALYRMDPWGEERAYLRAGIVASTIANCAAMFTRSKRRWAPRHFMPDTYRGPKKSVGQMAGLARSFAAAFAERKKGNK